MIKKLQVVNESLSEVEVVGGQIKSVYGYVTIDVGYDGEEKKVKASTNLNVNGQRTAVNESIDRPTSDKIELLKKDVNQILAEVEKRLSQVIEKYGFNQR